MVVGDNWVFIENPKTASSTIRSHLLANGGEVIKTKHMTLMDSQTAPEKPIRFVVVRNPWDRMVSAWSYNTQMKTPFEEWLTGDKWEAGVGLDLKRCPQTCWTVRASKILFYENLDDEFSRLMNTLNMSTTPLRKTNVSTHPPYQDVYTEKTRAIVADRFAPDIETWGYRYG